MDVMELESAQLLSGYSQDRLAFICAIPSMFGLKHYEVHFSSSLLLFMNVPASTVYDENAEPGFSTMAAGTFLFGLAGAGAIRAAAKASTAKTQIDGTFEHASDEQLIAAAEASRKHLTISFDDISSVVIDPPGTMASSKVFGRLLIRSKKRKVDADFISNQDVTTAIDVFKRTVPERADVRVELNRRTMKYERKK